MAAAAVGLTMALSGCEGDRQPEAVPASVGVDAAASSTPVTTASATPAVAAFPKPVATASPTRVATDSPSPIAAITAAVKRDPAIAPDATVEKVTISSIDSHWALAVSSSPSAGGAQVVLHRTSGVWKVVSLGSSEVGCGDGVPAAVMAELGLECPS
ncbi:conserved hypothetical protein [Frankia canadensis]|uniref:Uncharacterized protein n=1 Tax=Frankia canadensis TaxID=1836972 RepID=A0A2I2L206_9ACTN|nr:hypothetical protein [Frankia canadensis]SNQ51938.1 conserved hypothetical protein [Frankia canadensis]SOU59228.1 conserved hypothetical protein [Frankia canadensis]